MFPLIVVNFAAGDTVTKYVSVVAVHEPLVKIARYPNDTGAVVALVNAPVLKLDDVAPATAVHVVYGADAFCHTILPVEPVKLKVELPPEHNEFVPEIVPAVAGTVVTVIPTAFDVEVAVQTPLVATTLNQVA